MTARLGETAVVRQSRSRHCFAMLGDLSALKADVVVIPTDVFGHVRPNWAWAAPGQGGEARSLSDHSQQLRDPGFAWIEDAAIPNALALNVAGIQGQPDLSAMILHLRSALRMLEEHCLADGLRSRPLVAMPVIGIHGGGLGERTGDVLVALLEAIDDHFEVSGPGGLDIVLVARDPSTYAALQHVRRERFLRRYAQPMPEWLETLRASARSGDLAIVFGAGVSASLGLPLWGDLLDRLAQQLPKRDLRAEDLRRIDPIDAATLLIESGGQGWFTNALVDILGTEQHSLAHGLLASLRPPLAITTNYDRAFERATEAVTGFPAVVLPWDPPGPGALVVKLHGDVAKGQLVLSRDQFVAMHAFRRPLAGVLQSRMLIGHVLAVGTSMSDATLVHAAEEFHELIRQTQRSQEEDSAPRETRTSAGTVVLTQGDPARVRLLERAFDVVIAGDDLSVTEAAREVDVLLDWLAMQASNDLSFALDPKYRSLLSEADGNLVDELAALSRRLEAGTGPGRSVLQASVAEYLATLGAQSREGDRDPIWP